MRNFILFICILVVSYGIYSLGPQARLSWLFSDKPKVPAEVSTEKAMLSILPTGASKSTKQYSAQLAKQLKIPLTIVEIEPAEISGSQLEQTIKAKQGELRAHKLIVTVAAPLAASVQEIAQQDKQIEAVITITTD